jgi:hypothetical protein
MANLKISQLPEAEALTSSDLFAVVQGEGENLETRKITLDALKGNISGIVTVTYNDLKTLIQSSELVPGTYYRFEYQTIHKIPYTSDINTGPVEVLLAHAITANKVDCRVVSESHPGDIIYWRWDDNVVVNQVEDSLFIDGYLGNPMNPPDTILGNGITAYSPQTDRPGRIYYREDTQYRLSAPYDFRAVKFRRWEIKTPINVISTVKSWADSTSYTQGDIILNSGTYYMAVTTFNSGVGSSIATYCVDLASLFNALLGKLYYQSPTPDSYTLFPANGVYNGLVLEVDNTVHQDFTTFDNKITVAAEGDNPDNSGFGVRNYNCHIENYVPAWLEQVSWEYYPNNVFYGFSNNIKVGVFSENLNIVDSCNVTLGSYNRFGLIATSTSYLYETSIGGNNEYIYLTSVTFDPDTKNVFQEIGSGNNGIIISASSNFRIGNRNYGLYMASGYRNNIGSNNVVPIFAALNRDCIMEDNNVQISFASNAASTEVGNNNVKGLFHPNSNGNKVGSNNFDFSGLLETGTSVEGVYVSFANGNIVGNNTSGIRFVGNFNVYHDRCNSVTAEPPVTLHSCNFDVRSNLGIRFYSATDTAMSIIGVHFKVPLTLQVNDVEVDSQPIGAFNNGMNYNQSVGWDSANSIFARTLGQYTDQDNYVEHLFKLTLS